jgi:SAM-dependent methyltransferase
LDNYIFGEFVDAERIEIVHSMNLANFQKQTERVLYDYGLYERLRQIKEQSPHPTSKPIQAMEIGCSEGLFLHDLAAYLEKLGLLAVAELNGLDVDAKTIATAEVYAKQSQPPRPYLNFYVWDATQPFENNLVLRAEGKTQFDYIYALSVLEYLPAAQASLARFYQMLKPGGVLYLRCMVTYEGPTGWKPVHPILRPFFQNIANNLLFLNDGIDVATAVPEWLEELGAISIRPSVDRVMYGGNGPFSKQSLRSIVMLVRNAAPFLIKRNLLTQAQYDEIMATLYRELSPDLEGFFCMNEVIVRKPF